MRGALLVLCGWLALLAAPVPAGEPVPLPALQARVTDLTGTLDATQRGRLEADLAAIERSGKAQVAVLLLPSTQPETIEAFGIRLAEAWKVGRKGVDDGLIIIVAKDDRRTRIEVGYGLEGVIPDAIAKRIVEERMLPAFRQGDFFGGLRAAVGAIGQALGTQPAAAPPVAASPAAAKADQDWMTWLFFLAAGAGVLRAIFGLLGSLVAAAIGGGLAFFIFGSLAWAVLAAIAVFVLSFFHIGFGGGGIGGSSSGGGFGGGGGGFGGGGASGRW